MNNQIDTHAPYVQPHRAFKANIGALVGWLIIALCAAGMALLFVYAPLGM